ncbi:MAG: EAL domain-containing protein [Actinomycetota bacterium]|nr:EAL domain-containing protein [Actinomycetota bacterium]
MPESTGEGAREEAGSAGSPPGREGDLSSLAFARGQTRALELIATGAGLEEVLEFVVRTIEDQAPGMRGSVLLLEDGLHLRHGAAPSLPAEYCALIDGLPIGPVAGSCGTAMWEDRRVIVSDIATDPLWEPHREAALPFGLRACWSTPLHSSTGRVVGSFAMYYDEPREPTPRDLWLADVASHLSGIAVEHAWAAAQLRRRAAEQAAVAAVGQRALVGGDDQALMQQVVSTVSSTCGDARVALFERTGEELLLRAVAGWPPGACATPDDGLSFEVPGGAQAWGALCVALASGAECSEEQTVFLQSMVNVLAAAIERSEREERIRHQALHDQLTGLPNRALLMSLLAHAIDRERRVGRMLAVLLLDLDNFKLINDSLGHAAGDELLAALAPRLRAVVRQSDTVARFGGDEFVVIAEDVENELEAVRLAERITQELRRPFSLRDGSHTVTASIGVAVTPSATGGPDGLLRDADAAMYRAKEAGGAGHQIFDTGMRDRAVVRTRLVGALREAVERQEFDLDYQRIISLADRQTVGVEALLRWRPAVGAPVGPAEFVPAAEDGGLIRPIGDWVLKQSLDSVARWPGTAAAPWVSVNVSAHQVASTRLAPFVAGLLGDRQLAAERLILEITETALVDEKGASLTTVASLHEMGVRLALDDFGTGFSPLHHLLSFPIYALKVDKSFIAALPESAPARAIVAAIAVMAHELGKVVIAEGVETEAQLAAAAELGCDYAQGFLLGRPSPEADLLATLAID